MAVTLAQAKNFTQDKLTHFIIDEFRTSPLLELMVFDDNATSNNGQTLNYVYNRVSTYPQAGFRAINSEHAKHEAATTQHTSTLKVLGGAFEIDRVIQKHVHGIETQLAFQYRQKVKAATALFADTFINGDSAVNELAFDGLEKAIAGTSTDFTPAEIVDLSTVANIEKNAFHLLAALRKHRSSLDAAPTAYLVSADAFAVFQSVADKFTQFRIDKTALGAEVINWGESMIIPLGDKPGTSDPIIKTDPVTGTTTIYAVRIAMDGIHAIAPRGDGEQSLISSYLPNWSLPGAVKMGEVEMVTGIALKATRAAGAIRGIKIQ